MSICQRIVLPVFLASVLSSAPEALQNQLVNTGFAQRPFPPKMAFEDSVLAFVVDEVTQGQDLNGDGDRTARRAAAGKRLERRWRAERSGCVALGA